MRPLCYFHKALSSKLLTHLYELIPPILNFYHNPRCYRALFCRTDPFRNSFLPLLVNGWNKLDPDMRTLNSHVIHRKKLLTFVRASKKGIYNIYDPQGFKLLNRLRLGFSYLRKHNIPLNFSDTVILLCSCALETESTDLSFLTCQNHISLRTTLMGELSSIDNEIVSPILTVLAEEFFMVMKS